MFNFGITFGKGTPNEVKALDNINLTIDDGSFVVVLGTNGSGKSTLLNGLAGNFFPDTGTILLDGINITRWPEHKRASLIGRVFQNPFSGTAPDMSIAENLSLAARRGQSRGFGPALHRVNRKLFYEKIRILNMGLEDRLDNPIGKLSGGQRQALTLLMATWQMPRLLLLDEHTAALDPKTATKVIQLTADIIRRDRLTTLMVTHSMQQAVAMGDRLIMMHNGRVAYDFRGVEKQRLKAGDLLALFDDIRRIELIDAGVAVMLEKNYV
ncbi:MAG: ABC transporter ATP-binding protein [Bacteroidetes bacterium HGW-Bacteroidetes-22]|nr:MAG: ABC transporter ATP-binding protein [Bacteroidetes bacterium HGW-Bacteroidetes-22]